MKKEVFKFVPDPQSDINDVATILIMLIRHVGLYVDDDFYNSLPSNLQMYFSKEMIDTDKISSI